MGAAASRAALAVCVVLVTGACGSGGAPHAGPQPSGTASAGEARPTPPSGAVRTRSQSELEQAVIGAKDVPGWKTNTVVGRGADGVEIAPTIGDVSRFPHITPAVCEPLSRMVSMVSGYQESAVVEQFVSPVSPQDERFTEMALRSYRVADAPKVVGDLRTSLRSCSSFQAPGDDLRYTAPQQLPDPQEGDEAISYRINQIVPSVDSNGDADGGPAVSVPLNFVVVRCGATIAAFYTRVLPGDPHPPQVPMEIVRAQTDKLSRLP